MAAGDLIGRLPAIGVVRDRSRALAVLDAILSPEWEYRYYSFDRGWSPGHQLASMRDGSGNEYSIVFSPAGAFARGFDHESVTSPYRASPPAYWPGPFGGLPEAFADLVSEPAFCDELGVPVATACFWRQPGDSGWRCGDVALPDTGDDHSAERLFGLLADGRPQAYQRFAEAYYEVPVDIGAVRDIYALAPLTQGVVTALNPEVSLTSLGDDLRRIGYP